MIRALVIDDERFAREELLNKFHNIKVIGECDQGETAILKVLETEPDVIFLDVEMPKMNGIDVAKKLIKLKTVPLIIFATAFPQFAAEAFRINAVDYLLKPYEMEPLTQAVDRVTKMLQPAANAEPSVKHIGKLPIEKDGGIEYIALSDIAYIYPEGKLSFVVAGDKEYEVRTTLKKMENRLEAFNFFRVHRSYIVNLNFVKRMTPWFNGAYELELEGIPHKIPVSRNYVKELQRRLAL